MPSFIIQYYNDALKIGLVDWQTAFLFDEQQPLPVQLKTELHRGQLVYRVPGSSRRISYRQIKKQLVKRIIRVTIPHVKPPF